MELLTPREVAHYLGIHPQTLKEWRSKGYGPPAIHVGGLRRYRPDVVAAWLDAQPVTAG